MKSLMELDKSDKAIKAHNINQAIFLSEYIQSSNKKKSLKEYRWTTKGTETRLSVRELNRCPREVMQVERSTIALIVRLQATQLNIIQI